MHFGTKQTLNSKHSGEIESDRKMSRHSHRARTMIKDRAKATGAFLLSVALVVGLMPIIAPDEIMPETQAAQVAQVTFEGKTKAEVEEMMKHMTIDEIVDAMPLKDKVSQLFVTYSGDVYSNSASSPMASYTQLSTAAKNRLASYPVGGVCYFLGDIKNQSQIQSVSKSFQDSNKYGMFLAVDEEGGRVQRIGGTTYDGAKRGAGIGTQVNAMYTYKDQGTSIAKSNAMALANNLLMTGMNWDFAPVADTNSNPSNTVIGYRAYSNNYNQAAELVSAAISGFHEKNVMTSIKHFPGHGDTSTDSHAGAALVNKKISQLMSEDLIPFKAGIAAGTDSVMLGHLSYIQDDGSLSSDDGLIATNSPDIITKLLREQLRYDGIVITDGMQMGALTNLYGKSSTTTKAGTVTGTKYNGYITAAIDYFMAGGDMFLLCGTPFQAIDAIITEVGLGTISEDRIDESVARVMKAKRQYNIIPAQEDDTEATYISSDGAMEHGTFAAMWNKASTQALQSGKPAPVVRLNKNVTANSNGSFGTGTNIAANGDLTLTANHSVTVDLNGFTLNKNLSGSSSAAGKHIFNIPANATVTVHDSSSAQNGKITGAGGGVGTVAYATGASAKFIVDSGNITGNTGTSLIYSDASAVVRLGIQDVAGNNAGLINITNNTAEYAVDFSGTMYLMGETVIKDNGGANLYFNGENSIVNVQDRGLTGGKESIGVTVSATRAANVDLIKPAGGITLSGNDLNALFYDDGTYQLELDTNIKLVKVEGDVRFSPADGSGSISGTWDEIYDGYASKKAGTITLLKDVSVAKDVSDPGYQSSNLQFSPYAIKNDTVLDLNGKKLELTTNARNAFSVQNGASFEIKDDHKASSKSELSNTGNEASFVPDTNSLVVYVDKFENNVLATYKTTYDLSSTGVISVKTDNEDVDGIIDLYSGNVSMNGGAINSNGNGRAIVVRSGNNFTMNDGYLFNGTTGGHASSIWVFGNNASAEINGGVIALNKANNTSSGSAGALGIYASGAKATVTGGVFTGNSSSNHGGAASTANNSTGTSLTISGGTFCHNTTSKNGGAIYANSASNVNISNALITNNSSVSGGGIYMNGSTSVNLSGSTTIMNNSVTDSAGGIYNATSGKLSIKDNIVIKDNIANGVKSDIAVTTNGNKISVNGTIISPSRSIGIDLPNAAPGNVFATGNGYTITASDAGKFFIDTDETLFGSLDGNNNIYLEQGEAQYVSSDGNMENGAFKELWAKYFASGANGTITLMKDVKLSLTESMSSSAPNATLQLNGHNLALSTTSMGNTAPIIVSSGTFTIDDNGGAVSSSSIVETRAGQLATWNEQTQQLKYYVTRHDDTGIVTDEHVDDLSKVGSITYTSGGTDPDGIIQVQGTATLNIQGGRLTATNTRAVLNGVVGSGCSTTFNINGGYLVGNTQGIGSVMLARNGSQTHINGGVIAANKATGDGTFWFNGTNSNTLSMSGGIVAGNSSQGYGGAFRLNNANNTATFSGGAITNNYAVKDGGGIYYGLNAPAAGFSMTRTLITANKAGGNGGGIWSAHNVNDPNSHVDANEAAGQGGGIYTASGLIADSLCVSDNVAKESAGIYALNGITMKGDMSINGNTTTGSIASNLDIRNLSPEKVRIVGTLGTGSKIGLSIKKNSTERNQKVVSSSIGLNDSYSDMFYDDANANHVLRFNDGNDGLYLIQEDISGDELGSGLKMELGNSVTITGKNRPDAVNGTAQEVLTFHGPAVAGKADSTYYTNGSNGGQNSQTTANRYWERFLYKPISVDANGNGVYELVTYYKQNTVDKFTFPEGYIYLACQASYNHFSDLPQNAGDRIVISNLDSRMSSSFTEIQASPANNLGTIQKVISEGTRSVDYKIHYIYHYPVSEVMTGEYYVEDQTRIVEKTGTVGQLAYVPFDDMAGYLASDFHNCISTTLQATGTKGGADWYYQDDSFQGMHGSTDSINDLYVIYEHVDDAYTYAVEYYDADTGELIKKDEGLTSPVLPSATTSMKTLYEYEYDADNPNNVETIESASDEMVLKLYFKKWPTYSIEYYDADTGEQLDESIIGTYVSKPVDPKSESPITIDALPDSLKTIDGYDYVETAGTINRIESVAQDGSSKLKLYFEKILYRPYSIEYYDKDTGELVGTLEKANVKAGTKVILPAINEEYAIPSENVKYRIVPGDVRNVTEITVPRSGDVPTMKVYGEKINTTRVHIQRYEYDGSKWVSMGLPTVIDCDSNTEFDVLSSENRTKYVDGISGYIFLPNDPKNVTRVHVGGITDPTPVVKLHYAKTEELASGTGVQKTPNDNGLVPIERVSTKDFINIELFDFGNQVNSTTSATGYKPIFKGYPLEGIGYTGTNIGNYGETIQIDVSAAIAGGDMSYDSPTSGYINRLGASSTDNKRAQGANAAINGLTYDYLGWGKIDRQGASINPMSPSLDTDGNPVLVQGNTSLGYLFPNDVDTTLTDKQLATGDYLSRKVASGIDGLFDYNPDTGYYSYSSYRNHAEYNASTNEFDVYDVILTPNVSDYQFGNFLPFTDINSQATAVKKINSEYMQKVAKYCRYKAANSDETQLVKQYGYLADSIEKFDTQIKSSLKKNDYTYSDLYNYYFTNGGNPASAVNKGGVVDNAIHPENAFIDPVTGNSIWEDAETFYNHMYMTDYDEPKNFFFGITFDMSFVQPPNGTIGEKKTPMQFHFEGDDDVLIYIDGKLFLNLAGIHRQVGGDIDFENGTIIYKDLCYETGKVSQASYPANSKYRDITNGIVHFDEVLRDAGYTQAQINDILNEKGTFKDWSQHTFKMFYLERGSGSGVMSLDFNLPVIPENTLIVSKEIAVDGTLPDDAEVISNPYFNFQLLKCNSDGSLIRDVNNNPVPYADEGTEYLIYENGIYTGKHRTVDANGIITLKENQYAVITGIKHNDEYYRVRELIDKSFIEQYSSTLITSSDINGNNAEDVLLGSTSTDPQNHIVIDGVEYIVRTSKPIATSIVSENPITSTLFENWLDPRQLGSLAIYKSVVDELWEGDADKDFYFAVSFDGKPVPMTTESGTKTMYDVYNIDDISSLDSNGNRVWNFENASSTAAPPRREVPATGIIALKANQVAVMRYMVAGSKYAVAEVSNPDANGLYHPIYKDGQTGTVAPKTFDTPVPIEVANQRAENLVISKQVENPSDLNAEFDFELTIDYADEYVNGDYEYDIVPIDTDTSNAAELVPANTATANFADAIESGQWVTLADATSGRNKITFTDGKASFKLKADEKIIIYGLPYRGTYSVTENGADGYQVFHKAQDTSEFSEGVTTSAYVLDSKSTDASASNTVEFKNRKVEDLSVSKTVSINVIDALLGKYNADFQTKFTFNITDATYQNAPLNGEYTATLTDTYNKADNGSDMVTDITVTFTDGTTSFELSHGQTMTIHGLPYGTTYVVSEESNPAYKTSYKIGDDPLLLYPPVDGLETPEQVIESDNQIHFTNSLIMSGLPTTGGIGLIVIAMALIGGMIFLCANMRRRRLLRNSASDNDETSEDDAV